MLLLLLEKKPKSGTPVPFEPKQIQLVEAVVVVVVVVVEVVVVVFRETIVNWTKYCYKY